MTADDHLELMRVVMRLRELAYAEQDDVRRAVITDLLAAAAGAELTRSSALGARFGVPDWRIRELRQEVRAAVAVS